MWSEGCWSVFFDCERTFKYIWCRMGPAWSTCALVSYSSNFISFAPIYWRKSLFKLSITGKHINWRRNGFFHRIHVYPVVHLIRSSISKCVYLHFEWSIFESIVSLDHIVRLWEQLIPQRKFIFLCIALSMFGDELNECLLDFWIRGVQELGALGWIRSYRCNR